MANAVANECRNKKYEYRSRQAYTDIQRLQNESKKVQNKINTLTNNFNVYASQVLPYMVRAIEYLENGYKSLSMALDSLKEHYSGTETALEFTNKLETDQKKFEILKNSALDAKMQIENRMSQILSNKQNQEKIKQDIEYVIITVKRKAGF